MKRYSISSVIVVLGTMVFLSLASSCPAATWDVSADFSFTNNPNGDWIYGYSDTLNGPMIIYTNNTLHNGVLQAWDQNALLPDVIKNPTASEFFWPPSATWPAYGFSMHPGWGGEFSYARWTAPVDGFFDIQAAFSGYDSHPTTTDVHVLVNGASLFASSINGFGPASEVSYSSGPIKIFAGQIVDFAVGNGFNGAHYDTTGLSATITTSVAPLPGAVLPGAVLLLGSGLAMVTGFGRVWPFNRN